jgi:hypothetical protein
MARPLDEKYDTQMEVERDPCGAWMAIHSLVAENGRLLSALHATIARPAGVVPDVALEFYDQYHAALGRMQQTS